MENKKKTYIMEYTCKNCGTTYLQEIPLGCSAEGKGEKCPYCGTEDSNIWSRFSYRKPCQS